MNYFVDGQFINGTGKSLDYSTESVETQWLANGGGVGDAALSMGRTVARSGNGASEWTPGYLQKP